MVPYRLKETLNIRIKVLQNSRLTHHLNLITSELIINLMNVTLISHEVDMIVSNTLCRY